MIVSFILLKQTRWIAIVLLAVMPLQLLFQQEPFFVSLVLAWTPQRQRQQQQQPRRLATPNRWIIMPTIKRKQWQYFQHYYCASSSSSSSSFLLNDLSSTSSTAFNHDGSHHQIIHQSEFLGDIYRIQLLGSSSSSDDDEDDDDDFLTANAVPTFAAIKASVPRHQYKLPAAAGAGTRYDAYAYAKTRGLEGVLNQGPAFVLDHVLSKDVCEELIRTFEDSLTGFGSFQAGKNHHGALQVVVDESTADAVGQVLSQHIDIGQVEERRTEMMMKMKGTATSSLSTDAMTAVDDTETHDVRLVYAGLNRRWRVYRYAPGGTETFAPHIDAGFPPSGLTKDGTDLIWDDSLSYLNANQQREASSTTTTATTTATTEIVSRLTVLMYLNDDFVGGETKFYQPNVPVEPSTLIASVKPRAGSCLVFPQGVGEAAVEYARKHWPLHEGSPVMAGNRPKYVIRSDILFATTKEALPLDSELFQNDHLVRQAFLPSPTSLLVNDNFLSHVKSLYNPHMGVEDISYLLYSIVRFTKKRKIVEIGAGYTSLWILQALKDNDEEIARITKLSEKEQCKLLNIQWANKDQLNKYANEPASLLCIDNCEHQKETATGACAVAKSLGLESYLQFLKGDAFEMKAILEESSIDVLWCDFGVGSNMKDFMRQGAWSSLRLGGLLLCHSTITNQRTRSWLEAARNHEGEETTGIPAGEYTEISFLEPHKYYQNSVSIFQKRASGDEQYKEPIFSEYA